MTLPVPKEILNQHVAILGKTRSGKSSVMRLLVEGLLERQLPVCIVDPKGDWYGIKLAADGKRPGYPVVIFGGEHADIPINEHAGAHVAELFATGNRPCLIDLGGWMVAPRTRFWIDFASTLFKFTKGQRWLAVDEIHNFAPKGKVFDAEAGKALHWTNRLASEGLGKGLAMLFASQRPQKVHNDTLTSAETLIAMRVLHPSDRGAVADWIKGCGDSEGSEVLNSLAQMERGEGWVWSPEIGFGPKRVKFPMFHTYDSFRPQSVEDTKKLKGWAEVDLDEVRVKLAATIEKAKADDPRELRKQIAELKAQITKLPKAESPTKERRVEVLTDADRALLEKVGAKIAEVQRLLTVNVGFDLSDFMNLFESRLDNFKRDLHNEQCDARDRFVAVLDSKGFQKILGKLATVPAPTPHTPPTAQTAPRSPLARRVDPAPSTSRPARQVSTRPAAGIGESLPSGERVVLIAMAQYTDGVDRSQLSILTGYKKSTRNRYVQFLAQKGFAFERGDRFLATPEGIAALGDFEPLPVGDALREYWAARLPEGERAVFAAVVDGWPNAVARESIDAATGYKKSTRNRYIQFLQARKIVTADANGVRASEELFS